MFLKNALFGVTFMRNRAVSPRGQLARPFGTRAVKRESQLRHLVHRLRAAELS
jgi:hypothetical protein